MKTASANMITHLALGATTLNTCWKYERPYDLAIYGYTDHDAAITYDGVSYTPLNAGNLSNLRQTNRANPDSQDAEVPFATGAFTAAELRAGIWDGARYWVFMINPNSTADGIIKLTSGRLGEIEIRDYAARIEHRSLTQQLATPILRLMTPECNASLGDSRCGVSMAAYTFAGAVAVVTGTKTFTLSGAASGKADGFYGYGKITWQTGLNAGITTAVYWYGSNQIWLFEPAPYTVAAGDTLVIYAGCDRRKTTCYTRFNNVINFRGFDMLPGIDRIVVVPNNRRWVTDS